MDVPRHDADLAFAGGDHAGTVGADESRLRPAKRALHLHHVEHRNAFGDADDERDFRVDRFENRVRCERRRHIDHARGAIRRGFRFAHRVEHGEPEMHHAAFAGRGAADHFRAVGDRLFGMKRALVAGETLADHARVLVDKNGH